MAPKLLHLSWPYLAVLVAHIIWGINFVAVKLAIQDIPPLTLAFSRFFLAWLLLVPFVLVEKNRVRIKLQDVPRLLATGIFMVTLHISLFFLGISRTTASDASILAMTIPIFSILIGWWFLKEKVYMANIIGIVLGFIGTIVIIGLPLTLLGLEYRPQKILGDSLIVASAICWVIGASISKKLLKQYSTLTITTILFLIGSITFAVPAYIEFVQDPAWILSITHITIIAFLFITIASSITAFFLFEWSLRKLGIIKADLFQYIEPLIAITLAAFLLNEAPRAYFIVGALLVGVGVYWGTASKPHHKHHKAHRG